MEAKREKDACRALALSRRRAQSAGERHAHSLALCRLLESLPELRDAKAVLGYIPAGSECDLRPLYETLRRGGVTLAFPVTAADGIMEAYVPGDDLVPGLFGVPEPDPRLSRRLEPEALDAVLVPCVGFDGALRRLGHGMGFYDRYLARCRRAAAILTAFEAQRLACVPTEPHDRAFSVLVTERGVFRK